MQTSNDIIVIFYDNKYVSRIQLTTKQYSGCNGQIISRTEATKDNLKGPTKQKSLQNDAEWRLRNPTKLRAQLIKLILTPIDTESSVGNLRINLLPAFSSESFKGRTLHTTLMLHSSAAIFLILQAPNS